MSLTEAKFCIGQIIHHTLFDYRGVIVDIDPHFQGSEDWYKSATRTTPPKDRPWYHILVDGEDYATYVAERNLEEESNLQPIVHGELGQYFDHMENGYYVSKNRAN